MLQIITDSASDITKAEAEEMDIHIIPINITFEDGACPQETHEDFMAFYNRLEKSKTLPKTSAQSPYNFLELFQNVQKNDDEAIVITLYSGLSSVINSAEMAKKMCEYQKIYVVDSKQAIASQRILVEYAVKLRKQKVNTEEIVSRLEKLRERLTVNGMIDTLTYLRKGGRIPPTLARIGDLLDIKPLVIMKDNQLQEMGKVRGSKAGKRRIKGRFEENPPNVAFPIYFVYTSDREKGQEFMDEMIEQYSLQECITRLLPVCGVIGTHLGTGGVGLAYVMDGEKI